MPFTIARDYIVTSCGANTKRRGSCDSGDPTRSTSHTPATQIYETIIFSTTAGLVNPSLVKLKWDLFIYTTARSWQVGVASCTLKHLSEWSTVHARYRIFKKWKTRLHWEVVFSGMARSAVNRWGRLCFQAHCEPIQTHTHWTPTTAL